MRRNILVLAVIACFGLAGCGIFPGNPISPMEGEAKYGAIPSDYQQIVMNQISSMLIDPSSAQYQFTGPPSPKENGWHGQVLVNAKNSMGGYVGRQAYEYLFQNGNLIMIIRPNGVRVKIAPNYPE